MYQIVCIAYHSETNEKLVIYQKLYDDYRVHARPYDMFVSEVDHNKYPEVTQRYRFELINQDSEETKSVQKNVVGEVNDNDETVEACAVTEDGNEECNQDLMRFLDADTFEEKHNLLVSMKRRLTDRLIDDLAASIDVIVEEGDIDTRYKSLMTCIDTRAKFECNRY